MQKCWLEIRTSVASKKRRQRMRHVQEEESLKMQQGGNPVLKGGKY
jgi:hypothetical protein